MYGNLLGKLISLCVIITILGLGWYFYTTHSANLERERVESVEKEKINREQDRLEREKIEADSQRRKEQDEQQRKDREKDLAAQQALKLRQEQADRRRLDEAHREQEDARMKQEEYDRVKKAAAEESARLADTQRNQLQLADEKERARHDLAAALKKAADLTAEKTRLETLLRTYNSRITSDTNELESIRASWKELTQEAGREFNNRNGTQVQIDMRPENGRFQARVNTLNKEIKEAKTGIPLVTRDLRNVNAQLAGAAAAQNTAAVQLKELGITLDPSQTDSARVYPTYVLNDGRRITAVKVIEVANVLSITQENGKFVTIAKADVKEVLKADPVVPGR